MRSKKPFVTAILSFLIIISAIIAVNRKAIFQRGNPLPYLISAAKINKENPFQSVENSGCDTYISPGNISKEFITFAENKLDAEFVSQEGSVYIFSSNDETFYVKSEVYWGKYTLWDFPKT